MSEILSNHDRTIKSPVNRSKSKQSFSFCKSTRFDEIKSKGCKTFSYELPMLKNLRCTSMGFGKKYNFIIKHINTNTPYYDLPSDFNTKKPTSPSFSFGIARHFYDRVNIFFCSRSHICLKY